MFLGSSWNPGNVCAVAARAFLYPHLKVMARPRFAAVIFSALTFGARTECVPSTGSCAGLGPDTDAATLLQSEAIAMNHFKISQKNDCENLLAELKMAAKNAQADIERGNGNIKKNVKAALTVVPSLAKACGITSAKDEKDEKVMVDVGGVGDDGPYSMCVQAQDLDQLLLDTNRFDDACGQGGSIEKLEAWGNLIRDSQTFATNCDIPFHAPHFGAIMHVAP